MSELHYRMVIILIDGTEIPSRGMLPVEEVVHNDSDVPTDLDTLGEVIREEVAHITIDAERGPVVIPSRQVSHIYFERIEEAT